MIFCSYLCPSRHQDLLFVSLHNFRTDSRLAIVFCSARAKFTLLTHYLIQSCKLPNSILNTLYWQINILDNQYTRLLFRIKYLKLLFTTKLTRTLVPCSHDEKTTGMLQAQWRNLELASDVVQSVTPVIGHVSKTFSAQ